MTANPQFMRIIENSLNEIAPTKEECIFLLNFQETSLEAGILRSVADNISRKRFGNESIILGQIGIEINKCSGKCKFCSFSEEHTDFSPSEMALPDILWTAEKFNINSEVFALFLMAMHEFDFDKLLNTINILKTKLDNSPKLVINVGDIDYNQAKTLKQAGITGAYHVCRLREGVDTAIDPDRRRKSIKAIKDAGLDWYNCCEPIGPEHTNEELVEQIFLGIEYGCFQHATMRRVYIPSSPLAKFGQITELRLGQITAVVALASLDCPETQNIAVHEPNIIGLSSGANVVYAESGANPRDTKEETSISRGRNVTACKKMLYEAGFTKLLQANGNHIDLSSSFRE